MSASQPTRISVLFSGHVQGVGFRFSTSAMAKRYAVSGFVRNLPNGQVELVAEGNVDELDNFVAEIKQRMQEFIRDVKIDRSPASGEFTSFAIQS